MCRRLQQFLEVTDLDNLLIIKGVVFSPDSKGTYHIAVGSEGEDRTGTYTISMSGQADRVDLRACDDLGSEPPSTGADPQ